MEAGVERWARVAFAALCVATLVGTLVYPTYPNYDSYYSLLWGHEIVHGHLPHFEGFEEVTPDRPARGRLCRLRQ